MNRFINFVVFALLITGSVLAIIVSFDLEISTGYSGSNIPYKGVIFTIYTFLVGFFLLIRSLMRWFTLQRMRSLKDVVFRTTIAKSRKRLNTLLFYIEALYLLGFGFFFQWLDPFVFWCGWILLIAFLDTILCYFVTIVADKAQIVLTPKALAVYERQLKLIPLANMREADIHFAEVFIYYKKDFTYQFSLDGVPKEQLPEFKEQFFKILDDKNVIISEDLRKFGDA